MFCNKATDNAASFDGQTSIDVGYHGKDAFVNCFITGTKICGCWWGGQPGEGNDGYPSSIVQLKAQLDAGNTESCVDMYSQDTVTTYDSSAMGTMVSFSVYLILFFLTLLRN